MSTRQLRISDPDQIRQKIAQCVGRKLNIVFQDGTATVGVIKSVDGGLIDIMNMAQRRQRFPLSSVTEIYLDSLA